MVLVLSKHRLSCGEAKNVGLSFARGRKILFTDADVRARELGRANGRPPR